MCVFSSSTAYGSITRAMDYLEFPECWQEQSMLLSGIGSFTVQVPGVQSSVAWLMDNRAPGLQKKKKSSEKAVTLRSLKATPSQKFNR